MLQLCPVGRCWTVLFVTVIGGLLTTVNLIELETSRRLINTDESVSPYTIPLADQHDIMKMCEGLGEEILRAILSSNSKYAAKHVTKNANAYTPANHINVKYNSFLPSRKPMPMDDKMRSCKDLGEEALRRILKSTSNDYSHNGGKKINKNEHPRIVRSCANAECTQNNGIDIAQVHRDMDELFSHPLYPCQTPQRQSINMEDPDRLGRTLIPANAVVFTCRNDSGCCPPGHTCGIKTEEEVVLKFMVLEQGNDGKLLTSVVAISFTNHTECKCRPLRRSPQCTLKCPSTFRMQRRGRDCVCECNLKTDDRKECENIMNGDKALKKKDLTCVTSGRCAKPACSVGQFDVSQGKCPKKSEKV